MTASIIIDSLFRDSGKWNDPKSQPEARRAATRPCVAINGPVVTYPIAAGQRRSLDTAKSYGVPLLVDWEPVEYPFRGSMSRDQEIALARAVDWMDRLRAHDPSVRISYWNVPGCTHPSPWARAVGGADLLARGFAGCGRLRDPKTGRFTARGIIAAQDVLHPCRYEVTNREADRWQPGWERLTDYTIKSCQRVGKDSIIWISEHLNGEARFPRMSADRVRRQIRFLAEKGVGIALWGPFTDQGDGLPAWWDAVEEVSPHRE